APSDTGAGVGATNQTANVVLRVNRNQATEIAWAGDNGNVCLVLRARARAPPQCGRPGDEARHHDRGEPPRRRPAGGGLRSGPPPPGWTMMTSRVKTLVAIDAGVDHELIEAALPEGSDIQVVAVVDGLEESWTALQETATDLIVVACAGHSE